ncbi:23S rRNA (guanosine(2251)-2'-O)-methyltransferase RlmB [Synechococcus sp. CS-1328]|uniref:23S rRNA (guanosine(2251)-2'-O)-methyltransferase RlmB n=1 Tax=Synechococcus sp. CS-1328 TaxID=2847976 RepID=UPI00223A9472|nr:23S rRNA (guanosine(2251)-2'-O)-methyltransferase RlmB [Synechococcus sp. CS-1328]
MSPRFDRQPDKSIGRGGRDGARDGGREGRRDGARDGGRDAGRDGGRDGERHPRFGRPRPGGTIGRGSWGGGRPDARAEGGAGRPDGQRPEARRIERTRPEGSRSEGRRPAGQGGRFEPRGQMRDRGGDRPFGKPPQRFAGRSDARDERGDRPERRPEGRSFERRPFEARGDDSTGELRRGGMERGEPRRYEGRGAGSSRFAAGGSRFAAGGSRSAGGSSRFAGGGSRFAAGGSRFAGSSSRDGSRFSRPGRSDERPPASRQEPEPSGESESFSSDTPPDLLWGRHAAQAALESGRPIHRVWCTPEMRFSPKFLQLLREAKASGVLVEEVTWARLGQLTSGAVHQGIVLQTAAAETLDLPSLIEGCREIGEPPLLMALDSVTDPHNLGAIARSAEALGAHGLVLPQRRSAGLTGSVAKVAAGALEHLPVARVVNLNRALDTLKKEGYRVVGLASEGSVTLEEADLDGPLVIVTGSEGDGLSMLTRRSCDQLVRIPLRGATPSLNASVATALMLYEVARRGWMKTVLGSAPAPRIVRPAMPSAAAVPMPAMSSEPELDDEDAPEATAPKEAVHSHGQIQEADDELDTFEDGPADLGIAHPETTDLETVDLETADLETAPPEAVQLDTPLLDTVEPNPTDHDAADLPLAGASAAQIHSDDSSAADAEASDGFAASEAEAAYGGASAFDGDIRL